MRNVGIPVWTGSYRSVIDQACSVKMVGYWPSSFFFLAFLWTKRKSRFIKTEKKKDLGQYPAILTEQAWSIKDLLYGQKIKPKNLAFAGTKRAIPSRQDRPMLPAT